MLSVLMRSGSPALSLRPLGATVVALALMGCLEPPRLPTAGSDDAAPGGSDSSIAPRDGGEPADSLVLPERDPATHSRLVQGGVGAVSPAWMLRGRLVSGGATQASPQWRVTAKIIF